MRALPPALLTLLRPEAWPHAAKDIELLETHISWVLLVDRFAYKIKKPLRLAFLDFSTLQQRHAFCHREVDINSRYSPDRYQDVVAITDDGQGLVVQGNGPVVEYAVRMKRFSQDALLSEQLRQHKLAAADMDRLAERIADYHAAAERAGIGSSWADLDFVIDPVRDNFKFFSQQRLDADLAKLLHHVQHWTEQQWNGLQAVFTQRAETGMIRDCHGDLHLGNLIYEAGQFEAFDAIEFDDHLRWIDTMAELAFLVMDLQDNGYEEHAHRLVNRYVEAANDHAGLSVLDFYKAYRALVRAKILWIKNLQHSSRPAEPSSSSSSASDLDRFPADQQTSIRSYFELAERYTQPKTPAIWVTHGLSGSGKSTAALRLVQQHGAIRIRSDVVRKELAGMDPHEDAAAPPGRGIYDPKTTEATYRRLLELAASVLAAGYPVVVDAAFLLRWQRQLFRNFARESGTAWAIIHCEAPTDDLRRRLDARRDDPSDASASLIDYQLTILEPVDAETEGPLLA